MSATAPSGAPIQITLPDGSVRTYTRAVSPAEVAADIGPGLAKAAIGARVNGTAWDIFRPIGDSASLSLITTKDVDAALDLIRHDTAHVLAMAVQELFPGTQVTIGPNIDDGFFYDFHREKPFTLDDLPIIEARMREIVARDVPTRREVWDRAAAIAKFESMGEAFKAEIIRDLPSGEDVSIYYHGDWFDLCRGPHLASTARIGTAFKLTKVAGAYWRGDHRNPMLTRIYGTAWRDQKELDAYLLRIEEAEKRDHRRIGREMDLFHLQEEASGQVFWHPKGYTLFRTLENYVRRKFQVADYVEVKTPLLMDRRLWEASGHWEKYREHMFISHVDEGEGHEPRVMAVKPMNCPGHVQIFKQGLKSYRDLPIRMAEFGSCHRYEPSGALHGIMRVRGFTQDDAHIFMEPDHMVAEAARASRLIFDVYKELGFENVQVKLSTRPEQRIGTDENWDRAEAQLAQSCDDFGVEYILNPGEGAFYGPKLEFTLFDAIGRGWQCGTVQVDFNLPDRFEAEYVGADGQKHRPAMLHRAVLGSLERFVGVLIEHYAGKFPLWLAPVQVVVATITSEADSYAEQVLAALKASGLRTEIDCRNEKINLKVREHSLAKVPVLVVLGKREGENRSVSIRRLGSDAQTSMSLDDMVVALTAEATPPDLRAKA
jgi:threonyl-tRNA synthetase